MVAICRGQRGPEEVLGEAVRAFKLDMEASPCPLGVVHQGRLHALGLARPHALLLSWPQHLAQSAQVLVDECLRRFQRLPQEQGGLRLDAPLIVNAAGPGASVLGRCPACQRGSLVLRQNARQELVVGCSTSPACRCGRIPLELTAARHLTTASPPQMGRPFPGVGPGCRVGGWGLPVPAAPAENPVGPGADPQGHTGRVSRLHRLQQQPDPAHR